MARVEHLGYADSGHGKASRIDVRRYAGRKQRALAAHHSQISGNGRLSAVARVLVRLPAPVFGLLLGRKWYVEAKTR